MDEPCKKHTCKYLGSTVVTKPYGMDVLNDAIDKIYVRALDEYKKIRREKKLKRQRKLHLLNRGKKKRFIDFLFKVFNSFLK